MRHTLPTTPWALADRCRQCPNILMGGFMPKDVVGEWCWWPLDSLRWCHYTCCCWSAWPHNPIDGPLVLWHVPPLHLPSPCAPPSAITQTVTTHTTWQRPWRLLHNCHHMDTMAAVTHLPPHCFHRHPFLSTPPPPLHSPYVTILSWCCPNTAVAAQQGIDICPTWCNGPIVVWDSILVSPINSCSDWLYVNIETPGVIALHKVIWIPKRRMRPQHQTPTSHRQEMRKHIQVQISLWWI